MGVLDSKRVRRLFARVANNRKNCEFDDLAALLKALGFVSTSRGSHYTFRRSKGGGTVRITIPRARPVNSVYVDQLLQLIQLIENE
ncbi:MAG TPA: type II toxin-antitoxin system HicA family toxin [Candidatus Elarobacter sp.]|nr:type II toxin-antitoxin system HicA family toxin [Candidatus Elarobacter sp.]